MHSQGAEGRLRRAGRLLLALAAAGWLLACAPAAVVDPPAETPAPAPTETVAPSLPQVTAVPTYTPAPSFIPGTPPATTTAAPAPLLTAASQPAARLIETFPVDGDEGVPLDAPLTLRFDAPVTAEWVQAHLTISPTVEGALELSDATTAVFRPAAWPAETRYTVCWNTDAEDVEVRFATFPDGRVPLPCLMYHRLAELPADAGASTREWSTAPADFRAHIQLLTENGYHVVPLEKVLDYLQEHAPLPPRPIAITFDDGYRDFAETAWPALRKAGMPATVFLILGHVGYGAFLTWEQVTALAQEGTAFGSHTLDHVRLKGLEDEELRRQLQDSRRVLEERLEVPVQVVSYPYGAFDARVVQAAEEAGYRAGVTINPSRYQRRSAVFTLSRLHLPYDAEPQELIRLLTR
ncbi:MAG: polysaccharide deacetylase family protein [Anaerolineae bacterium]